MTMDYKLGMHLLLYLFSTQLKKLSLRGIYCMAFTLMHFLQFPGEYSSGGLDVSSCYSYQSLSPQTSRDGSVQPQYPKPIYSYR